MSSISTTELIKQFELIDTQHLDPVKSYLAKVEASDLSDTELLLANILNSRLLSYSDHKEEVKRAIKSSCQHVKQAIDSNLLTPLVLSLYNIIETQRRSHYLIMNNPEFDRYLELVEEKLEEHPSPLPYIETIYLYLFATRRRYSSDKLALLESLDEAASLSDKYKFTGLFTKCVREIIDISHYEGKSKYLAVLNSFLSISRDWQLDDLTIDLLWKRRHLVPRSKQLEVYHEIIELAERIGDGVESDKAKAHCNAGEIYLSWFKNSDTSNIDDYRQAKHHLTESIKLGRSLDEYRLKNGLYHYGQLLFHNNQYDRAKLMFEEVLDLDSSNLYHESSYRYLAEITAITGTVEDTLKNRRQALLHNLQPSKYWTCSLSNSYSDRDSENKIDDLVTEHLEHDQREELYDFLQKCLEQTKQSQRTLRVHCHILRKLGELHTADANVDLGKTYLEQSLEIASQLGYEAQVVMVNALIAENRLKVDDTQAALDHFETAYLTWEDWLISGSGRVELIYHLETIFKISAASAEISLERLLSAAREDRADNVAKYHYLMGKKLLTSSQYSAALAHFGEAAEHYEDDQNNRIKARYHMGLSNLRLSNIDKAISIFSELMHKMQSIVETQTSPYWVYRSRVNRHYWSHFSDHMKDIVDQVDITDVDTDNFNRYQTAAIRNLRDGNLEEAQHNLLYALAIKENPYLTLYLGWVFKITGNYQHAREYLDKTLKFEQSDHADITDYADLLLWELDQMEKR